MTFCYILPVERLFYVFSNNQLSYRHSTCFGTAGGNVLVKSRSVLIAHCPEISEKSK
jgi:hypothetical protein